MWTLKLLPVLLWRMVLQHERSCLHLHYFLKVNSWKWHLWWKRYNFAQFKKVGKPFLYFCAQIVNILGCHMVSLATVQLCLCSCKQAQIIYVKTWLYFNKTLFRKVGSRQQLAHRAKCNCLFPAWNKEETIVRDEN